MTVRQHHCGATTLGGDLEEGAPVVYLMGAIAVAGVVTLLWKVLVPQRPAARAVLAPDDDPEFLRGLNSKRRPPGDEA
ncbi:MAG: hypothetical protein WAK86_20580 [Pseudonocardiaceae bacterium]